MVELPLRETLVRFFVFMKKEMLLIALLAVAGSANAVSFSVQFDDPGGTQSAYYADLTTAIKAAGQDWARNFVTSASNPDIVVKVGFAAIPTANGGSASAALVGNSGGFNIYDQGAAHKMKTGIDVNGSTADINFTFGTSYLANTLWFDPDYATRTAAIPTMKVDAYSVILHEFGHALVFNGWRDGATGALPGNYMSTFDQLVTNNGGYNYFNGAHVVAEYGGPVGLTLNNYGHYGNNNPGPSSELVGVGLMNGVVTYYQHRWNITDLDRAFAYDVGFEAVPEPATMALLAVSALALARKRRK